jgi:5-deoxy-glucuronate isomerase
MSGCGRVRKELRHGWTPIIDTQLEMLQFGVIRLDAGDTHTIETGKREFALVLVHGECDVTISDGQTARLGPRDNPFEHLPYGLAVTREHSVCLEALRPTLIGAGSAPAETKKSNTIITPDLVKTGTRGADNWTRHVRMVCWSDNTEGNLLIAGETCTPSGNWSTVPPHRHQYDVPGEEFPYEEVYFFQFSRPQGFGLTWQFDAEGEMDQAFSLRANDAVYMAKGYHPVACAPGSTLYHLSLMAGPRRMSKASVHPAYRYLLEEKDMENQFTPEVR